MASVVKRARVALPFAASRRRANSIGEATGSSVTTVDPTDMRALVSRRTVVVTELPRSKVWDVAAFAIQ
jgi:hypothetical protein